MATKDKQRIKICYGGLLPDLNAYAKDENFEKINNFRKNFQLFSNVNVNPGTRSAHYFFKALSKIKKENPDIAKLIHVQFWGNIYPGNISLAKEENLEEMVEIIDFLPYEESLKKLKNADILFLPLESEKKDMEPLNIPSKLYEYLELEKPILALVNDSDCKEILKKSGLAQIAKANSVEEIAKAILTLAKFWEEKSLEDKFKANKEYIKEFSAESISKKFKDVVLEVIS